MNRDKLLFSICPMDRMYDCCNSKTSFCCDDCKQLMNKWLDEYDKHVIEQYKADTRIKDTIKEIHDNVAREMYCKGIDDFAKNMKYEYGSDEIHETIDEIAEQLKEQK